MEVSGRTSTPQSTAVVEGGVARPMAGQFSRPEPATSCVHIDDRGAGQEAHDISCVVDRSEIRMPNSSCSIDERVVERPPSLFLSPLIHRQRTMSAQSKPVTQQQLTPFGHALAGALGACFSTA